MSLRYRPPIGLRLEVALHEVESRTLKDCMSTRFYEIGEVKTFCNLNTVKLNVKCKNIRGFSHVTKSGEKFKFSDLA